MGQREPGVCEVRAAESSGICTTIFGTTSVLNTAVVGAGGVVTVVGARGVVVALVAGAHPMRGKVWRIAAY